MTTSKRVVERKSARFQGNIARRGSVPETVAKKGDKYPVSTIVIIFFIFVVVGSVGAGTIAMSLFKRGRKKSGESSNAANPALSPDTDDKPSPDLPAPSAVAETDGGRYDASSDGMSDTAGSEGSALRRRRGKGEGGSEAGGTAAEADSPRESRGTAEGGAMNSAASGVTDDTGSGEDSRPAAEVTAGEDDAGDEGGGASECGDAELVESAAEGAGDERSGGELAGERRDQAAKEEVVAAAEAAEAAVEANTGAASACRASDEPGVQGTPDAQRKETAAESPPKAVHSPTAPQTKPRQQPLGVFVFWLIFITLTGLIAGIFLLAQFLFLQDAGRRDFISIPPLVRAHLDRGQTIKVVVLLHGLGGSSFLYRDVITLLADRGLRALALDLPGSGLSTKLTSEEEGAAAIYPAHQLARILDRVLEALGIAEPVHLVLHDTGGVVGTLWAADNVHRVRSITLIDTPMEDPFAPAFPPAWLLRYPHLTALAARSVFPVAALLASCCVSAHVADDVARAHAYLLQAHGGIHAAMLARQHCNLTHDMARTVQRHAERALGRVPRQLLWSGEAEEQGEEVRSHWPLEDFHLHEGKRWPQEDHPGDIAEAIARFSAAMAAHAVRLPKTGMSMPVRVTASPARQISNISFKRVPKRRGPMNTRGATEQEKKALIVSPKSAPPALTDKWRAAFSKATQRLVEVDAQGQRQVVQAETQKQLAEDRARGRWQVMWERTREWLAKERARGQVKVARAHEKEKVAAERAEGRWAFVKAKGEQRITAARVRGMYDVARARANERLTQVRAQGQWQVAWANARKRLAQAEGTLKARNGVAQAEMNERLAQEKARERLQVASARERARMAEEQAKGRVMLASARTNRQLAKERLRGRVKVAWAQAKERIEKERAKGRWAVMWAKANEALARERTRGRWDVLVTSTRQRLAEVREKGRLDVAWSAAQGSAVEQQQVGGVVQDGVPRTTSNGTAGATDEEILASIPALGATLDGHGGCVFRVWAPHPQRATLVVKRLSPARAGAGGGVAEGAAAEGERVEMGRDGNVWFARVPSVVAGDRYHFVFEWEGKTLERRDARARATDYESNGCIVVDPRFSWTPFEPPPFEALNIYQLHVGAFTGRLPGGGTFAALKEKLPYIKSLGFNAVQMLPVHEYCGQWGYNPRLLFAPHPFYGTPLELRELVDAAHSQGMAVIFDVVLHHLAPNLNSLWEYDGPTKKGGLYFDGGGDSSWGKTFAWWQQEVKDMVLDAARLFLNEYNGDGLRFDCVHAMPWKVSQSLTWHLHREFPHRILISEITPEVPEVLTDAGYDATWMHTSFYKMRSFMLSDAPRPLGRLQALLTLLPGYSKSTQCVKYFLGSHDQVGCRRDGKYDDDIQGYHRYAVDLFGGRDDWTARAKVRMWFACQVCAQGIPMTFMGSESMHPRWWGVTPRDMLDWQYTEDAVGQQMQALVRAANGLRTASAALQRGAFETVHYDEVNCVIGFRRQTDGETLLVVVNAGEAQWEKRDYGVRVGGGDRPYVEVFNSQDAEYGGWATSGNAGSQLTPNHGKIFGRLYDGLENRFISDCKNIVSAREAGGAMAGLAKMKKKLLPLQTGGGVRAPDTGGVGEMPAMANDPYASYKVSEEGHINLMSQSFNEYAISEQGLQVNKEGQHSEDSSAGGEKTYRCASNEMLVFGAIGSGASSVVCKAIHIPSHRLLALKKVNVFEKDKRHQLLNEIRTLCEAPAAPGLVEFYGAFYQPDSGQINIALEYMDGGSLADVVQVTKTIPENVLSAITRKVLQGMQFLHSERRMVHRDIKPANILLLNLNGVPKITDFGISTGLDHSLAMCATFVGTVTYMSPERIANQNYSFPADIWSLGLALLECGTGTFPYTADKGPINLMLQVMEDPAPTLPPGYSAEFQSFVNDSLEKDPFQRPTAEVLLQHPFITKHADEEVDLAGYIQNVVNPTDRLKDLSNMLMVHYYMLFDGPDKMWPHIESFYKPDATLMFGHRVYTGGEQIFATLTSIRTMMLGEAKSERLVHTIENLECCAYGRRGVMVRVSGALVVGRQFIPPPGTQVEGVTSGGATGYKGHGKKLGSFIELFVIEPGEASGSYLVAKQELYVQK
ncbi:unnamed protein product [Closterium sp. Yama58-4]|nr:unnamed protein product [Closterium sp. Yama58-4]